MQTTRYSLLARLHDAQDRDAWNLFLEIYQPAIFRSLRLKGFQEADADDLTQQVLLSVTRALSQRPHDPDRARFRTWLERVIRNAAINAMQRRRVDSAIGGSTVLELLADAPANNADIELLEQEHQKQLFRVAAKRIEHEFHPDTWQAFWQTMVLDRPVDEVARELNKQIGSIYAARSRVVKRLRLEIETKFE